MIGSEFNGSVEMATVELMESPREDEDIGIRLRFSPCGADMMSVGLRIITVGLIKSA